MRVGESWHLLADGRSVCLNLVAFDVGYRLKELCDALKIPLRTFYKLFLRDIGLQPKEWLVWERMVVARRMLAADLPPYIVADKVGFSNNSNFRREFTRVHGVLPKEFQANCRRSLPEDPLDIT